MRPHSAAARHSRSFWFDLLGGATMAAPGGVPERPKGTGCKPVGSAYGGSNPPAPTRSLDSADALGQPDENALGASDVAEPIHVFVLDDFVDELCTVLAEP